MRLNDEGAEADGDFELLEVQEGRPSSSGSSGPSGPFRPSSGPSGSSRGSGARVSGCFLGK